MALAGFSLGGNFALRAAMQAPDAGIPLDYVLAVCPIIDPAEGLFSLEEQAPWFYQAYFMRKWRRSLLTKQAAFPDNPYFQLAELKQNLRGLTEALVLRHTEFDSLESYLDGYSVAGDKLQAMQIPATILTSRDDPVIPVRAFEKLELPANVELDIARYGGHCGFIRGWDMTSFSDDYIVARFNESPARLEGEPVRRLTDAIWIDTNPALADPVRLPSSDMEEGSRRSRDQRLDSEGSDEVSEDWVGAAGAALFAGAWHGWA